MNLESTLKPTSQNDSFRKENVSNKEEIKGKEDGASVLFRDQDESEEEVALNKRIECFDLHLY